MVFAKIILSFPGGFVLGMVTPLNFAKLDNLAVGGSAGLWPSRALKLLFLNNSAETKKILENKIKF